MRSGSHSRPAMRSGHASCFPVTEAINESNVKAVHARLPDIVDPILVWNNADADRLDIRTEMIGNDMHLISSSI